MCCQTLLFDTADLKHVSTKRDFAAHCHIGPDLHLGQQRSECDEERNPRGCAIFGNSAGRQVDVNVAAAGEIVRESKLARPRTHERERSGRGLLQDVAHVAGEVKLAGAGHLRGFDEQQVTPGRRPGKASREASPRAALGLLTALFWRTENSLNELGVRHDRYVFPIGEPHRDRTAHRCSLLLELANACFVRVRVDHRVDGLVGKIETLRR